MLANAWYVTQCRWLDRFQHFGEMCCVRREGWRESSQAYEYLFVVDGFTLWNLFILIQIPVVYTNIGVRTALLFTLDRQVRYKEHALAYKNNYNSAYAKHLINYGNSLVHMEDITDIIQGGAKRTYVFYICLRFLSLGLPQIKSLRSKTLYSRRSESFHSRRNCNCATRNVSKCDAELWGEAPDMCTARRTPSFR